MKNHPIQGRRGVAVWGGLAVLAGFLCLGPLSQARAVVVNEDTKIVPSSPVADQYFGGTVDWDGSRILVGARKENASTGAAYIFTPDGMGGYTEKKLITNESLAAGDSFGSSVRLHGDLAFVCAYTADVRVELDTYTDMGAVWIFQKDYGGIDNWGQIAMLTPPTPSNDLQFGSSLAVDGDTLLVGASKEGGSTYPGAAYVLKQDGLGIWNHVQKLTPSESSKYYGQSCDLDGDTLIVGAYSRNKAFVYDKDITGNWVETKVLTGPSGSYFGVGTSIQDDTIVVGAYREKVNGLSNAGSAYVFGRDEGGEDNWGQVAELAPLLEDGTPDPQKDAYFGHGSAIDGDRIVITAYGQDGTGAAYAYGNVNGSWMQIAKLLPSDVAAGDLFGRDPVLSGSTMITGCVNAMVNLVNSGAVYTFTVPDVPTVPPGDANLDGVVDAADAARLAENWLRQGDATWRMGDFNGDRNVDDLDASILAANWVYAGGGAAVPEPSAVVLVLIGLVGLRVALRGRRK